MKLFTCGIEMFTESQHFNSCLNRKLSVDTDGNIRVCPSMKDSYGNVEETELAEVVDKEEVAHVWSISKNQVDTCRVCEFRYICTDCRAHVVDKNDLYSKPEKCFYDPYTATWAGYR